MRTVILAATLLAVCPVHAQTAPPATADTQDNYQKVKRDTLGCEGPFAKDTSHGKLVTAFGLKNVVFKEVDGAEGSKEKATVLFDDDPTGASSCIGMTRRRGRGRT